MVLARSLEMDSRLREAIAVLERASKRAPNDKDPLNYLARLQTLIGDHEEALATYGAVLGQDDSDPATWILAAQLYRTLGRKTASVDAFRQAIARDPANAAAWWALANYFPGEITEDDVGRMRHALSKRPESPHDAGPLHIALGLVADARGDQSEAFAHVAAGKRYRAMVSNYSPDQVTSHVDQVIGGLPAERIRSDENATKADAGPVFVVGMPRSGSTLLERILGRHSSIAPGGELPLITAVVERLRQRIGAGRDFYSSMGSMPASELHELGQWYLERSRDYRRSDEPFFIDKWNSNWLHVGVVRLILPNAPIIDLRRDALDCCWSNYKMLFGSGLAFSNDLRHLGRFYRDYVRLMDWASSAAPGRALQLRYEDLVDDLELSTRRVLDFLELAFEPACLEFHQSSQPVATPSSEQVRRPINRDSIGSAEPYRQWLAALIEELGPLADRPG
jgi:tetratricopeptide (TPR) repeat protein